MNRGSPFSRSGMPLITMESCFGGALPPIHSQLRRDYMLDCKFLAPKQKLVAPTFPMLRTGDVDEAKIPLLGKGILS